MMSNTHMIRMETLEKNTERLEEGLRDVLNSPDNTPLVALLEGYHPADIAEVMERLDDDDSIRVFRLLDSVRAAEVLDELDTDTARYLLDNEVPERIAALLDLLPMDDAAEIIAEVTTLEKQQAILQDLFTRSPEDAEEVRELLSFKPGTAGRLMTDRFISLRPDESVESAFATVRQGSEEAETLNVLYVREGERLVGVLSLRDLLRARADQLIADIMVRDIVSIPADMDQEEVARLVGKYDFTALPVLLPDGTMAGIVTVDDVVDILNEEQTEDFLKQSGISAEAGMKNLSYFSVPIWRVVRSRIGWLLLLFVGGTLTGEILKSAQSSLHQVTALATFIPLLIGTGGNTGAQSVSTIIRAIALGEVRGRDLLLVLLRELFGGLLLGMLLGGVAFGWTRARGNSLELSLVVALTVVAVCTWANLMGSLIPMLAHKLKIDPALVSAPLITTLVDATGLVIYLAIARLLLTSLH
jgi:magnesium transporter